MIKKLFISLLLVFLVACNYQPVDMDTTLPRKVQEYSLSLRDSTNGLHLAIDISTKAHYLFLKDSSSVRLVQKYNANDTGLKMEVPAFILLMVVLFLIGLIIGSFLNS